ncbi:hypothetical protein HCN44_004675 [Aphidius gifuensis]|uniref:Transglutaminase-like domain-containing protein n=1 Tax=Aphidius gifuensis TaxID=684658 RepID=A0A834XXA4_APHGI|nr:hypothetical protein HCN44_004675 [Aphidius gifuensis]
MQREAGLVIRRGQDFYLNLKLNRDYDESTDEVTLVLNMEVESNIFDVTDKTPEISIPLMNYFKPGTSTASLDAIDIHSIKIKVFLPVNLCIAKYRLSIKTNTKSVVSSAASFKINELLYIIFNPWCADDDVFVDDEEHRQEYVLSEDGLIWTGNASHMRTVPWAFRHFSRDVLDCAFYLINAKSNVDVVNKATLANSNDYDKGVLLGRWDGNYADGKHPCAWLGSSDIIQKYHKEKTSVKYGQCWVYGGVLTTLCRALGIPSRVVTNFASAHDTNGNLRIERCFDFQGKEIQDEEFTGDSVWNFHVWNEVWMRRTDLKDKNYDGWQVVDATPQETSSNDDDYQGQYACGPVPVLAIKLGDLDVPYDGKFVFAEVNADVYYFRKSKTNDKKMFDRVDQHRVGQNISTKAVGSYQREDITDTYKFPEDSIENRESFHKARTFCQDVRANEIDCPATNFNSIKVNLDATKNVEIGQPISIVLSIKNESNETHDVTTKLVFNAYQYTGIKIDLVKQTKADVSVGPKASKIVKLDIYWDDYKASLMSTCMFKIICLCSVPKENYDYFADSNIQLIKPKIKIDAKQLVAVDEKIKATMSFTNPLPIKLTNCQFRVLAPGLERNLKIKLDNIVEPGAVVSCYFTSVPKRKGNSTIIVNFESNELNEIEGFLPIIVVKNLPPLPPTIIDPKPDDAGESDQPSVGLSEMNLTIIPTITSNIEHKLSNDNSTVDSSNNQLSQPNDTYQQISCQDKKQEQTLAECSELNKKYTNKSETLLTCENSVSSLRDHQVNLENNLTTLELNIKDIVDEKNHTIVEMQRVVDRLQLEIALKTQQYSNISLQLKNKINENEKIIQESIAFKKKQEKTFDEYLGIKQKYNKSLETLSTCDNRVLSLRDHQVNLENNLTTLELNIKDIVDEKNHTIVEMQRVVDRLQLEIALKTQQYSNISQQLKNKIYENEKINQELIALKKEQAEKSEAIENAKQLVALDEKIKATMSFTNPLPIELTNCQFRVLAPGLERNLKIKLDNIVEPGAVVSCHFTNVPKRKGNSTIIVNFESNELNGIEGFLPIIVVKNLPPLPPTIIGPKPDDAGVSDQPSVGVLKPDDSSLIVAEAKKSEKSNLFANYIEEILMLMKVTVSNGDRRTGLTANI